VSSKLLPCEFLDGVFCSYRKSEKFGAIIHRCLKCRHYLEFVRELEAEEDRFFEELDRLAEREKLDG